MVATNLPDLSLKELVNLPISEWYPLGIQLGLEDYQLKIIRNSNAGLSNSCQQSKIDMFQKWLDSGRSSYTQLYEALVDSKMMDAANLLGEKYPAVIKPLVARPQSENCSCRLAVVVALVAIISATGSLWMWIGDRRTEFDNERLVYSIADHYQPNHSTSKSAELDKLMFTPGAAGAEVVEACVNKIASSNILPDDNGLLRRIAYVMSKDGTDLKSDGGIWQLSEFAFDDTMATWAHYRLPSKYNKIRQAFLGIDWPSTTRQDLDKPFFSALAARLYLSNFKERIPNANRIRDQAYYWKDFYMRGVADERKFLAAIAELEQ